MADITGAKSRFGDTSEADMSDVYVTTTAITVMDLRKMLNDPRLDDYIDIPVTAFLSIDANLPSLPGSLKECAVITVNDEPQLSFIVEIDAISGLGLNGGNR